MTASVITPERTPSAPGTEAGDGAALSRWLRIGALGAGAAGGLHVAVAVDHLGAGELAVGFFLLTAAAQLGLAGWLLMTSWTGFRPDRRLVTLALVATVALIGLYLVAYTTSLLDAFAVTDAAGGHGSAHAASNHDPGIDPVTGVDYSTGIAVRSGPVAMAGEVAPVRHAPGLLGPVTVAAEALLIAALTALQPARWRRYTVNGLLALGGLAWALWFTGVLG
ncbi:hypothetical protein [Geodermatophilus sp. URMC 64]